ncbi:MAG: low molecular weight protein-tyrosine-phosphatase [Reyranellaceae bacterium]
MPFESPLCYAPGAMPLGILFVCSGNICRSPMAEGVFRGLAEREGVGAAFVLDSAGTLAGHVGQPPTPLGVEVAQQRGYEVGGHRARLVTAADIDRFDYVLGMDRGHVAELRWLATRSTIDRVQLLTAFAPQLGVTDIGDPYRGTRADYQHAFDLIEACCRGLLRALLPYVKKAI